MRRVAALLDARSESVLESLARVALVEAGLAPPERQLQITDHLGVELARVDFAWPRSRLAVEVDGFAFHSARDQVRRDRARANDLVSAGWRLLRYGWEEVHRGGLVVRVGAALRAPGSSGSPTTLGDTP